MTGTRLTWKNAIIALLLPAALHGCAAFDTPFLRMHASNSTKEDARRRWDNLRSNARLQLAQRHLEAGRLDDAERELNAAIAAKTPGPAVHVLAARIHLERGQLAEARDAIAAARCSTDDAELDYLEGVLEQRYGNIDAALKAYTHASDKAPLSPDYVMARAEMLVTLGRPRIAFDLIETRMRDFDRDVAMRCLASRIARTLDERESAVRYAGEAARLSDNDPATAALWGSTLVWAGQFREAVDALQPLARRMIGPRADLDAGALDDEGRRAVENFEEGGKFANDATSDSGWSRGVIHDLARACVGCNRHDVAVSILAPWTARHPRDLLTAVCVARAALAVKDSQLAATCLRRAHAADVQSPESLLLLAYAEFKLERFGVAADAARAAIDLDQALTSGFCLLGRAEQAQGRLAEARAAYERALAIDPDSRAAAALLRRLSKEEGEAGEIDIGESMKVSANRPATLDKTGLALRGGESCR